MSRKNVYKITFFNQGKVYEIYARSVAQSAMMGFIEVSELLFGEKSSLVLDPSEDTLKSEFKGVKRSYIPMHAIIRIDEVEKQGVAKMCQNKEGKVTPIPITLWTPGNNGGKS